MFRMEDWHAILLELGDLPSYAIGGFGLRIWRRFLRLVQNGVAVCSSVISVRSQIRLLRINNSVPLRDQNKGAIIC